MKELLEWIECIEDSHQQSKVRHTLKDILVIVLFATLVNADDWGDGAVCRCLSGLPVQVH